MEDWFRHLSLDHPLVTVLFAAAVERHGGPVEVVNERQSKRVAEHTGFGPEEFGVFEAAGAGGTPANVPYRPSAPREPAPPPPVARGPAAARGSAPTRPTQREPAPRVHSARAAPPEPEAPRTGPAAAPRPAAKVPRTEAPSPPAETGAMRRLLGLLGFGR